VRKHIESSPTVNLHTYEIDYIRDIERPDDEEVGDEPFHQRQLSVEQTQFSSQTATIGMPLYTRTRARELECGNSSPSSISQIEILLSDLGPLPTRVKAGQWQE